MEERFSLKDALFNVEKVRYLSDLFKSASPDFDADEFCERVMSRLLELELKERINWIATVLEDMLPDRFEDAVTVIERALPPPLDPTLTDDDFGDFIFAPLGEYIERRGLSTNKGRALQSLKTVTKRFSMEFYIRAFLNTWTEETLSVMQSWAVDENYHVRRLVSEGTRPKLPWASKVTLTTKQTLPLLDVLHADKTRYVTRSVSNHLNDISKFDPDLVVSTLKKWREDGKQTKAELLWMTRHALRTLVKQGHAGALELLGYRQNPDISVTSKIAPSVVMGEALGISVKIVAHSDEPLLVDYAIDFVKSNGTRAPKVFKLKQLKLKKGEQITLTKAHKLKDTATTFKLFPGTHRLIVQVNGTQVEPVEFELCARPT
ncbi:DNA alkylation repair protein [Cochlodiniinecator piscidefendens]|uniref:DNA alkylation repair protein n=1 Tax=Cochlodiniinecator piscidefendens TaxID=2715756 RepID=UPI00140D6AA6|nr:DNA alkylation repair protein [Cochlodiniinecator piscidefendens]